MEQDISKKTNSEEDNPENREPTRREIERAKNRALYRLGKSACTEHQIVELLRKKDTREDVIEKTIEWLRSYNYVNDEEYARQRVRGRQNQGWGKRAIMVDLYKKGVPRELSERAISEELNEDKEQEAAIRLAQKRVALMGKDLPNNVKYRRLVGALVRKGYSPDITSVAIRKALHPEEE